MSDELPDLSTLQASRVELEEWVYKSIEHNRMDLLQHCLNGKSELLTDPVFHRLNDRTTAAHHPQTFLQLALACGNHDALRILLTKFGLRYNFEHEGSRVLASAFDSSSNLGGFGTPALAPTISLCLLQHVVTDQVDLVCRVFIQTLGFPPDYIMNADTGDTMLHLSLAFEAKAITTFLVAETQVNLALENKAGISGQNALDDNILSLRQEGLTPHPCQNVQCLEERQKLEQTVKQLETTIQDMTRRAREKKLRRKLKKKDHHQDDQKVYVQSKPVLKSHADKARNNMQQSPPSSVILGFWSSLSSWFSNSSTSTDDEREAIV